MLTSLGPKRILIIRHGEKPDPQNPNPQGDPTGLSQRGEERAQALATAIPQRYPDIAYLFASTATDSSQRPIQTIEPLAKALGEPIDTDFADKQVKPLASFIMSSPQFAGKTVLISWHHGRIPQLVSALGGTPPFNPWPAEVFDRILQIDYPSGGGTPTVQNLPQNVLPGDSKT
jgi:phosphohistidine phosphatase SixA